MHPVADEDLLHRLRVEFSRGLLVHRRNLAAHGIALQPMLDEINERHLLVVLLAGDEILLRFVPLAHRLEILHQRRALRAHVAPVARPMMVKLSPMLARFRSSSNSSLGPRRAGGM